MTLTVRPDLEAKLAAVASTMHRDPQAVLDEAVAGYVEDEAAFLAAIQEARDSIARGEGIPHAQVMAEIDAIIAREERIVSGIRKGHEEAHMGEGTPHDEVFARLEKKLLDKYGVRV